MSYKIYDFACKTCSLVQEHLVLDEDSVTCNACGKNMTRLLSCPKGIYIKGVGYNAHVTKEEIQDTWRGESLDL